MGGLFALTGVLAAGAIAVVAWVVPAVPMHHDPAAARPPWPRVVLDPQLLRLNFGIFALHAVQMAMFVVVPVLLVERGLPLPHHWWVYLPVVLVSFALMMPPIIWGERHGRMRRVFLGAIGLMVLVQAGLGLHTPSLAWIAGWLLLFFVAFNILEASLPSLVSRMAPPASKGLALGVYNTTQAIGLFVGGAVGGLLARHGGAGAVFAFAVAAMLLWVAVAWGMRELPRRRDAQPVDTGAAVGSALD
jgi:predicted MFS family arabinose efflux permease